jgi:putative lipoprotein (rSAM/lipoprotein system)
MGKKCFILKSIVSALAFIFGFSVTVAAQYGVVETTFKINGNVKDLLSNVPIESIKVSMRCKENSIADTQSDSMGHFEFEMYSWPLANTYYFTTEDIDGVEHSGEFMPKDTSLHLSYEDFQNPKSHGNWHVERNCRYEVNLKLSKEAEKTDFINIPVNEPVDKNNINPEPILLPKDTLLLSESKDKTEIQIETWSLTEVYPNPTNGLSEIVIDAKISEVLHLQLFDDAYNMLIERTEYLEPGINKFMIDLQRYSAGNYFLVILKKDRRIVKKIIKL